MIYKLLVYDILTSTFWTTALTVPAVCTDVFIMWLSSIFRTRETIPSAGVEVSRRDFNENQPEMRYWRREIADIGACLAVPHNKGGEKGATRDVAVVVALRQVT